MEQLNRIELRGTVGSIRLQTFSDNMVARLTLATNFAYKDKEGAATIDTSWHSILARERHETLCAGPAEVSEVYRQRRGGEDVR